MPPSAAALATLVGGATAGLVAAAVMDVPMSRQPEGFTPAYIVAGALARTDPDSITFETAMVVHHAAGVLAGVTYGALVLAGDVALPSGATVAGVPLLPHVVAVVVVGTLVYVSFATVVLPRVGGTIYEERATAVRGQWLRSATVFGAAMLLLAPWVVGVVADVAG